MQFNIDKRFIEILNEQGFSITWEQFRSAYDIRRAERDANSLRTPDAFAVENATQELS